MERDQKQAVERAVAHILDDGTTIRVLAIEDVIIHKLIADRSKDVRHPACTLQVASQGPRRSVGRGGRGVEAEWLAVSPPF